MGLGEDKGYPCRRRALQVGVTSASLREIGNHSLYRYCQEPGVDVISALRFIFEKRFLSMPETVFRRSHCVARANIYDRRNVFEKRDL